MGLVEKATLIKELSPPLDKALTESLVDEFVSLERRYIQRDWEPAQLDGGQFCEVLARIIYHQDSGNLNPSKQFDECAEYVEDEKGQNKHAMQPRRDALHIIKVLRTAYKFRSQRGGVHISPTYKPNHMDSRAIMENVRWAFAETLRIFWKGTDREQVAKAVRELLQFDVPCIGHFEDVIMVQRTDLSAEEEVLVLLHYAGEQGFSRTELGKYAMVSPSSVTLALSKLEDPSRREITQLSNKRYRLTDLGSKRIREKMPDKLLLTK
ncbi:MAG TPA: hypothetical protein VNZ03_25960 [Terriglobales bacterium]|jgi:hypothetical protein|nr:hypothetical protein [Terriglobales bacterium]